MTMRSRWGVVARSVAGVRPSCRACWMWLMREASEPVVGGCSGWRGGVRHRCGRNGGQLEVCVVTRVVPKMSRLCGWWGRGRWASVWLVGAAAECG